MEQVISLILFFFFFLKHIFNYIIIFFFYCGSFGKFIKQNWKTKQKKKNGLGVVEKRHSFPIHFLHRGFGKILFVYKKTKMMTLCKLISLSVGIYATTHFPLCGHLCNYSFPSLWASSEFTWSVLHIIVFHWLSLQINSYNVRLCQTSWYVVLLRISPFLN